MKKEWMKRAAAAGLSLTLAAGGLSGCGGSGIDKEKNAMAKECVYSYQEFNIPKLDGDYINMMSSFEAEGRVYTLMQVEHYTENWYTDYHMLSFQTDGADAQDILLEVNKTVLTEEEMNSGNDPEDGDGGKTEVDPGIVVPLPMPRAAVEAPEVSVGTDLDPDAGTSDNSDSTSDGEVAADGDNSADDKISVDDSFFVDDDMAVDDDFIDSGEYDNTWEYSSLGNFTYGSGAVYGIRNYRFENYETGYRVNKNYICCWNLDGTVKWETEIAGSQDGDEWIWIQAMSASEDGKLTVILSSEEMYLVTVSPSGEMSDRKKLSPEVSDVFNSYRMLAPIGDGNFFVIYYDSDDWTKQYAVEYDAAADTLSKPIEIPSAILYANNGLLKIGTHSDLIYCTSSGLFTYNYGDEEGKKIMDYINSDLFITSLQNVIEIDDTHFVGMFYESYDRSQLKAGMFTHVPPEDIPDKRVMVLAGMWVDRDIQQRVIEFNRGSQEYRITIKDYSEYNSYDDYEAGRTKLNNDIVTGNMPDILVASSNLPIENYIAKGWLADINDYIKKDEELSKEEFLQNVFDAYSVKGKLYYVIPSFSVSTMVAKSALVGDRTSWTMSDMMELQKSLPEGTTMIESMTRSYFFDSVLRFCGNDFIDVETGKCTFDSEAFINLMEFAKSLPEEIVYDDDYWMNYESIYREDKTILMNAYIGSVAGFNYTLNGTFGEDISYIGFPSSGGKGAYLSYDRAYCISSRSKNGDGAWEFLRYYLTDEYQESITRYNLAVQKDIFEERAQEALNRPYWIDEEGEKHEYDDYFYMNGESFVLEPMTQEQIDKLVNYIYSVDNAYFYNPDIVNIIKEEVEAYFTDQKEAAEVANIIQRRAQVYVDENR